MKYFSGRISRMQYFLGFIFVFLLVFVIGFLFTLVNPNLAKTNGLGVSGWTETAIFILGFASLIVRRTHDLGWSGWLGVLFIIPPISFVMGLVLLFIPGTSGSNKYGPSPVGAPFKKVVLGL